jgi:hypothetical protein
MEFDEIVQLLTLIDEIVHPLVDSFVNLTVKVAVVLALEVTLFNWMEFIFVNNIEPSYEHFFNWIENHIDLACVFEILGTRI